MVRSPTYEGAGILSAGRPGRARAPTPGEVLQAEALDHRRHPGEERVVPDDRPADRLAFRLREAVPHGPPSGLELLPLGPEAILVLALLASPDLLPPLLLDPTPVGVVCLGHLEEVLGDAAERLRVGPFLLQPLDDELDQDLRLGLAVLLDEPAGERQLLPG